MQDRQKSTIEMTENENEGAYFPLEMLYHIVTQVDHFDSLLALRLVSSQMKYISEIVLNAKPEMVFRMISHLPLPYVIPFIQAYRNTEAYLKLNPHSENAYELLCYTLTTDNVSQIEVEKLQAAISFVQQTKPDDAEQRCLKGLSITATLLQDYPAPLGLENIFSAPFFINLAGMDLSNPSAFFFASLSPDANKLDMFPGLKKHLSYANLEGVKFNYADLAEANLRGANLHKASLAYANLDGAILREANVREVSIIGGKVKIHRADFTHAEGLDDLLHDLILFRRFEAAECLLACGANINSLTTTGESLLRYCINVDGHFNEEKAQWLIDQGLDINLKNINGETTLQLAVQHKLSDAVIWLVNHGANVFSDDSDHAYLRYRALKLQLNNITLQDLPSDQIIGKRPTTKKEKKALFLHALVTSLPNMNTVDDIFYLHKLIMNLKISYNTICEQIGFMKNGYEASSTYFDSVKIIQDHALKLQASLSLTIEQNALVKEILSLAAKKPHNEEVLIKNTSSVKLN